MKIKEYHYIVTTCIDRNQNAIFYEDKLPIEDSIINNLKDLYKFGKKEYGRCISKVFIDDKDGNPLHIGYVFVKTKLYEDTKEPYLQETWLSIERYREKTEREYLPIE